MAQFFAAGDDGSFDTPVELSIFATDGPGVSNVQWTKQALGGSGGFGLQKDLQREIFFLSYAKQLYSKMSHAFLLVGMFDFTLTKLSTDGDIFGATATV